MNHSSNPRIPLALNASPKTIVRAETEQQLLSARANAAAAGEPSRSLGKAVMSCFWNDYAGTVILNRIMGIEVSEIAGSPGACTSAPAKIRHQLVQFTLQHAMPGLKIWR